MKMSKIKTVYTKYNLCKTFVHGCTRPQKIAIYPASRLPLASCRLLLPLSSSPSGEDHRLFFETRRPCRPTYRLLDMHMQPATVRLVIHFTCRKAKGEERCTSRLPLCPRVPSPVAYCPAFVPVASSRVFPRVSLCLSLCKYRRGNRQKRRLKKNRTKSGQIKNVNKRRRT